MVLVVELPPIEAAAYMVRAGKGSCCGDVRAGAAASGGGSDDLAANGGGDFKKQS